ncbi:MAG: aldo/keto reductase, partial [Clostridiales bacterium]|nr:aldo/keto reductase [Clostridiales bacterium]
MLYNDFLGEKISRLGFGTMRLPLDSEGKIDEVKFGQMVDYAMANGVNYFDTAMPYHSGHSELAVGRALAKYPRDSFFLATKFPGHQVADSYDPAGVFEEQLRKCGVEYFDFYLLHNVTENSYGTYTDPKWGILDYFVEQKRLGRIRHLGFSTHGKLDMMKDFLDYAGEHMEFCQIQINYLDWTLQ